MELFQLILSAISGAFAVSHLSAFSQEIVDGGTKNRVWSFLSSVILISSCFGPIALIFPAVDFRLITYPLMALSGLINYVAYVAHQNQIYLHANETEKLIKLPFKLHKNLFLMKTALFLSRNLYFIMTCFFIATLISCPFLGASLYGALSLGMYGLNLLYQQGYFPSFLRTPYLYLNILTCLFAVFGVLSWVAIGLSTGLVAFTIYDYIRCHLWNKDSPTAQFPMADPTKKLTLPKIANDDPEASAQLAAYLKQYIVSTERSELHVTFNHFYQSYEIVQNILADAPEANYDLFFDLFNSLDFTSHAIRSLICDEMCIHDKFLEKDIPERCNELGLAAETERVDIEIAFLKREMSYFVQRLKYPSYRDLSHLAVSELHRYSRLLLRHCTTIPTEQQATLLLSIAMRTGSHCTRAYLDSLSDLADNYGLLNQTALSLQSRAVLMAQTTREEAFRTYYYEMAKTLKDSGNPYFRYVWADVNDYHTYEDFVSIFGANLYLRNPSLRLRFRSIFDVFQDRIFAYLASIESTIVFSGKYNVAYLTKQTVAGKLHPILLAWCEEHYPNIYKNIVYTEDFLINHSEQLDALAELMLVDLGILSLKASYSFPPASREAAETAPERTHPLIGIPAPSNSLTSCPHTLFINNDPLVKLPNDNPLDNTHKVHSLKT